MANYVDEVYISRLSTRLDGFHRVGQNFNFSCPLCGDSKTSKKKRRGWLLSGKTHYSMYCHNCGASLSFSKFLKSIDPVMYKEYVYTLMKDRNEIRATLPVVEEKEEPIEEVNHSLYIEAFLSVCLPIGELQEDHKAIEYLKKRRIPEEKWKYLFYIDNVRDISNIDTKGKYNNRILDNDSRIVMPIWSKDNLVGVSCRALDPDAARRYLIFKFEERPLVFGLYSISGKLLIDTKKPVYVVEGAMDSLFLENAIAVNGSDLKRVLKMLDGLELVFAPDVEPRNKEIVKVYKQIINSNNSVVIMPSNIIGKDINEIILGNDINIMELLVENTYKGLPATMALNSWKRT